VSLRHAASLVENAGSCRGYHLALEPVDMRLSFDRLSGLAKEHIGYEARSGALFVFFGRRKDALKVLFFDGSGMVIFYKRLDRGRFQIPEAPHADVRHVEVDDATLEAKWGRSFR
jgi:transposase